MKAYFTEVLSRERFFKMSRSAVTFISSRFSRNNSASPGLILPLPGERVIRVLIELLKPCGPVA